MSEFSPAPLPDPISEEKGPRWLKFIPKPIGEWFLEEGIGIERNSWRLICHPLLEARVDVDGKGDKRRIRCFLNGRVQETEFHKVAAAKQFAESLIVSLFRQTIPTVAQIRRQLRNSPKAPNDPPPQQQRRIAKSFKPPPGNDPDAYKCLCGFTWRDRIVWQVFGSYGRVGFYCEACLPPELRKEAPRRPLPKGDHALGIKCNCGEPATYVRQGKPWCDKCYDPRGFKSE